MTKALALALLLVGSGPAVAACVPASATGQRCDYTLTWAYTQSSDPTAQASGFVMQQKQPTNGDAWYDIHGPVPVSQLSLADGWNNDPGNLQICWQVLAYNDAGRSDPSNTVCATSPEIDAIGIKTTATVTQSHRATDTSSIIAILVNKDENIGAGGLELVYPASKTLTVSRRATNTSSVIAVLVNKSTQVFINP